MYTYISKIERLTGFKMLSSQNDKLKLLKPGSLQHLGENMLEFLLHTAMSLRLQSVAGVEREEGTGQTQAIFFDVLVI